VALTLGTWLGSLSHGQLGEVLTRRPDVLSPPVPGTIGELADRLQSRPSVSVAFHALPQPAVQLVEALQTFGGPSVPREQLAAALGRTADDPDLAATLRVLALRALVWPSGDELCMAGPLWSAFAYPLHLGPPAERLLAARNATELRKVAATLGTPGGRTKSQVIEQLVAAFRAGDLVRASISEAPHDVRRTLESVAWRGPVVRHPDIIYGYGHSANPVLDWALSRGLLVADGWQAAVMPGEVGMALRGPDWRAPFTPDPPEPALVDAAPDAVAREAAAAAAATVTGVTALVDVCATVPPALLKAGGVGTRELRRLARAVGDPEPAAKLWLELAFSAGLLAVDEHALLPTAAYDEWRVLEPAERLAPLLTTWWRLPSHPSDPALTRTSFGDLMVDLRRELLRAVAGLPAGQGLADHSGLGPMLTWRAPLLLGALDGPGDLPAALWAEAGLLGLVAHGALTPLGAALISEPATVPAVAGSLLPSAVDSALFQADLTAVVPGTPTAALAALLDSAADRESAGGAATWRFSPGSVRRALDAGADPADLLAALASAASGGVLPQPLEYLVGDVARRHGHVRVRTVACVLHAPDAALLAEIAATRSLVRLGLRLLAPTVLASAKPADETLAGLRAAGYAPVAEQADGTPVLERVEPRRAQAVPGRARRAAAPPQRRRSATAVDVAALAARLLAGPLPSDEPPPDESPGGLVGVSARAPSGGPAGPGLTAPASSGRRPGAAQVPGPAGPAAVIDFYATQLSDEERTLLGHAVERGGLVKIHYTNSEGTPSSRVIEPLALHGKIVEAWCHLREEERMFSLDRIDAVAPA